MIMNSTEEQVYEIETEHLLFRRILGSDCDALHEIFSNHDAMTYWSRAPHTDISQTIDVIIDTLSPTHTENYYFALCLKPASPDLPPQLIGTMGTITHETIQHETIQHETIQHETIQHETIQHETIQHEIGFILHPSYWRKGIGSEAIKGFLKSLWEARPKIPSVAADVDPRNSASLGLLKKFGFVETGSEINTFETHMGWCDSVYLKLERPAAEGGGLATVYEESP